MIKDSDSTGTSPRGEPTLMRIAKLPPFWREDPTLWFSQVEATFAIAQITRDETKFQYIVANADTIVLPYIADVIRMPPAHDRYETIKKRILSAFAEDENTPTKSTARSNSRGSETLSCCNA